MANLKKEMRWNGKVTTRTGDLLHYLVKSSTKD